LTHNPCFDAQFVLIFIPFILSRNKFIFVPNILVKLYGTPNKFGCIGTPSHKINNK